MKRITFIVNPISGTKCKKSLPGIIKRLLTNTSKVAYEIVYSEYAGHCLELATSKVKEGVDIIVAVGGDGTVNEVARALIHTSATLGIIPYGSGNGMARHLGIPMKPEEAVKLFLTGISQQIDYGVINNEHIFFCSCGVGFDAKVSYEFSRAPKRGLFTYFEIAVRENLKYHPEVYHLTTDTGEEIVSKAFVVACGNASQYGNDAFIAPSASMKDGLLDVTLIKPFEFYNVPLLSYQLFTRNIDKNIKAKNLRCKKLTISRERVGVMHFDGEPVLADKELTIEIVPSGLHVITPIGYVI